MASYIVGNWKMYKTIEEALDFVEKIGSQATKAETTVCLAVPFTAIKSLADKGRAAHISIGAQNMNDATEGAFTGEVAAYMLKDAGAEFVLLGHSERRSYFNENNALINRKIKKALEIGLQPIVCIGESYEEYQENRTKDVLREQLEECFSDVDASKLSLIKVAYEPKWAIGTGLALDAVKASEIHAVIRGILKDIFKNVEAEKIALLYGGSVNEKNAKSYLDQTTIDGLLVGSASLHPEVFAKIIELSHNSVQKEDL